VCDTRGEHYALKMITRRSGGEMMGIDESVVYENDRRVVENMT